MPKVLQPARFYNYYLRGETLEKVTAERWTQHGKTRIHWAVISRKSRWPAPAEVVQEWEKTLEEKGFDMSTFDLLEVRIL